MILLSSCRFSVKLRIVCSNINDNNNNNNNNNRKGDNHNNNDNNFVIVEFFAGIIISVISLAYWDWPNCLLATLIWPMYKKFVLKHWSWLSKVVKLLLTRYRYTLHKAIHLLIWCMMRFLFKEIHQQKIFVDQSKRDLCLD